MSEKITAFSTESKIEKEANNNFIANQISNSGKHVIREGSTCSRCNQFMGFVTEVLVIEGEMLNDMAEVSAIQC